MTKKDDKKNPALKKIEELDAQLENFQGKFEDAESAKMRALADLENFRRRETENRKNWSTLAVTEFLEKLVPNFFELSLGAEHSADEDLKKVVAKFFENLENLGVEKITPKPGESVDPEKHEVLMAAEGEPGKIVQLLEPGWKFGGKTVVPAKVSAAPES
ncbi:nucleotide exchange factor GrpE [bacterium]|jgi:molecular chaperone GrpE|nr:nucleotide exchange factor GrpE [bacterium]MBT6831901.1 nucleotide exchange factor GrpE [bacterium]MBT6996370.1 nucleotide exchange factor GrpE [bacterium]MBT7772072.1 nucleotide exchange factor GrpE [bacterium]